MELIALKLLKTFGFLIWTGFTIIGVTSPVKSLFKLENNWNEKYEKVYSYIINITFPIWISSIIGFIASAILYIWS